MFDQSLETEQHHPSWATLSILWRNSKLKEIIFKFIQKIITDNSLFDHFNSFEQILVVEMGEAL